jgi:sterol desaturase/sphingolipid hydroxylase (fatty acid hydroxylase superfamily)
MEAKARSTSRLSVRLNQTASPQRVGLGVYHLTDLLNLIAYQGLRMFSPRESYCLIYLGGALGFALAVMLWRRRRRRKVGGLGRLFGSWSLWTHASTLVDLKLYLLNGVLMIIAYGALEVSSEGWRAGANGLLSTLLGNQAPLPAPRWLAATVTTGAQVVLLELGYWSLHYAFHKIPALWAIHRVHHSAEVMTPLTEWRQHPLEFIAFANMLTFTMGTSYGVMSWLLGPSAEPFTLFQLNLVLLAHLLTFHHLRHSGIWIAATGWLGRLVHSPAHHQIHHSADPRHFDTNLGYAFSIWDWAFGTLCLPERRGRVKLGCDEVAHKGVLDALNRPFRSWARLLGRQPTRLGVQSGRMIQSEGRPVELG